MIMRSPLDDQALAGNWTLEPEQSSVGFTGRTMWGLVPVNGRFTEVTGEARKGQVIIPHGFGLVYDGVKHGANVNRLTKNTNRDFLGTPMHRYVPCRVEAL